MQNDQKVYTDKNIGNIFISRPTGNKRLVGSNIEANTFIRLDIRHAQATSTEFQHEQIRGIQKENIVTVELSQFQWGELISSIGLGEGVPCTITRKDNQPVTQSYQSPALDNYYSEKIKKDFEKASNEIKESFEEANDILTNKKSITKSDRIAIQKAYNQILRFTTDHLPFMQKLIAEDLEEHTSKAATQFKSDMLHLMQESGFKLNELGQIQQINDKTEVKKLNE